MGWFFLVNRSLSLYALLGVNLFAELIYRPACRGSGKAPSAHQHVVIPYFLRGRLCAQKSDGLVRAAWLGVNCLPNALSLAGHCQTLGGLRIGKNDASRRLASVPAATAGAPSAALRGVREANRCSTLPTPASCWPAHALGARVGRSEAGGRVPARSPARLRRPRR